MKTEDRACFNCESCELCKVPLVYAKVVLSGAGNCLDEADHWGMCLCGEKRSDHFGHFVSLKHVCSYHSDALAQDTRYAKTKK